MKKAKIITSILLAGLLIFTQVAVAFAAPSFQEATAIAGTVEEVTLETDTNTGVTTVLVKIMDESGGTQTVRISLETAESSNLGLVTLDGDGNPVIVDPLPEFIEIDPATVIPDESPRHPVGNALALFFSNIAGLDYSAIMDAHTNGNGFGVIAQALWLTRKLGGDEASLELFTSILDAKNSGEYSGITWSDGSAITMLNGTPPTNWGQFRQALMEEKGNLGIVMSQKNKENNSSNGNNGNTNNGNSNKDKNKDKSNNGHGNTHGNSHGNDNKP